MRLWHNYLLMLTLAGLVVGSLMLGSRYLHPSLKNTAVACKPRAGWQDKLAASLCAEYR